jgi:CheY-like chemotaxis protein
VRESADGASGAASAIEDEPDAILLDLMMPVMDGVTFAQNLRERPQRDVPIVVISADGNPQRAASVGARAYLAKPFDIETLLAHVAAITRRGSEPHATL